MMWLCISTGQLCLEVREDKEHEYQRLPWSSTHGPNPLDIDLTSDPNWDQRILSRITLDDIHRILCNTGYWTPMRISGAGIVLLGSLSCRNSTTSDHFDPFSKFALSDSLESADLYSSAWKCSYRGDGPSPEVKEGDGDVSFGGWTRCVSGTFEEINLITLCQHRHYQHSNGRNADIRQQIHWAGRGL